MSTPPVARTLTVFTFIEAIYAALVAVQGGIGALDLADPWNVLVPLGVAAGTAFFAKLAGRQQAETEAAKARSAATDTIVELMNKNADLTGEIARLRDAFNVPDNPPPEPAGT